MKLLTRNQIFGLGAAALVVALAVSATGACPFCTALKPTLAQRREDAAAVAIAECLESGTREATVRVHQVLQGKEALATADLARLTAEGRLKAGALSLLFAEEVEGRLKWSALPATEVALGYFAQAPSLRQPTTDRLRYFVRYLEHSDPLVSEDAFNEFGHAPYAAVQQVADLLPAGQLRAWLTDPRVPEERRGFYGLALGLSGRVKDRDQQAALLQSQIELPASDFRAGFDGILAGYLLVAGESGLDLIERRYLKDPQARVGDVRHVVRALRFYQEFEREISPLRLARALRLLLARPEFAAEAIIDLARWQDWDALPQIVALYSPSAADSVAVPAATRRAIVGYLFHCPLPRASEELARLRARDPAFVSDAERILQSAGTGNPNN